MDCVSLLWFVNSYQTALSWLALSGHRALMEIYLQSLQVRMSRPWRRKETFFVKFSLFLKIVVWWAACFYGSTIFLLFLMRLVFRCSSGTFPESGNISSKNWGRWYWPRLWRASNQQQSCVLIQYPESCIVRSIDYSTAVNPAQPTDSSCTLVSALLYCTWSWINWYIKL